MKQKYKFTILKSHQEKYALANKIKVGNSVSVMGIPKLRFIICTKLKQLEKGIESGKQGKLKDYNE